MYALSYTPYIILCDTFYKHIAIERMYMQNPIGFMVIYGLFKTTVDYT